MECLFHLPANPASLEVEDELGLDVVSLPGRITNNLGMVVSTMGEKGLIKLVDIVINPILILCSYRITK